MHPRIKLKILSADGSVLTTEAIKTISAALEDARPRIKDLTVERISTEANKILSPDNARLYQAGITDPKAATINGGLVSLEPTDPMTKALEGGYPSFDMKPGILAKAKKTDARGMPYATISFRHGVPGANRNAMPKTAYVAIQNATASKQAEMRSQGASAKESGQAVVRSRLRGEPSKATHKSGLYDDLTRFPRTSGGKTSSEYRTFRRVSKKSKSDSWIHPGFSGVHLFDKIIPTLTPEFELIIKDCLALCGLEAT